MAFYRNHVYPHLVSMLGDPKPIQKIRARLITIGGVAVNHGQIVLADAFEEMIALGYTSASVAVHGITGQESREGACEAAALEGFLKYVRDGVIVGHHIGHDIETINRATERNFGIKLQNQ